MTSAKKLDLGPTGRRVATAVRDLRKARGKISVYDLSKRLEALGVRIAPSGITRIEREERRVDADDLAALALALDVTPNALLLPRDVGAEDVQLTPHAHGSAANLWRWATGEDALPDIWGPQDVHLDLNRAGRFRRENRPHEPEGAQWSLTQIEDHAGALQPVLDAVRAAAAETGKTFSDIVELAQTIERVSATMTRPAAGPAEGGDDEPS